MSDVGEELVKPALRYRNPDPRGLHLIKFDEAQVPAGESYILLVTRMTKLPLWNAKARAQTIKTIERTICALGQNPDYKAMYEFAAADAAEEARLFMRNGGFFSHIITGMAV